MPNDKVLYIAGPYTGQYHDYRSYCDIDAHINEARKAAIWCANAGVLYFSPHLHSAHMEVIVPHVPAAYWYRLDLVLAGACQGILLLPHWEQSVGALAEREHFVTHGKRLFCFPQDQARVLAWAKGEEGNENNL